MEPSTTLDTTSPADGELAATDHAPDVVDSLVDDDLLVEEISIDGMCGVY